jgi:hemolysin III
MPTTLAPARPTAKPVLRGVSHEVAAALSLAGGVLLVAGAGPHGRAPAAVYAVALVFLFTTSALYHRPNWAARPRLLMRRVDHSAIFVLIAGTYTPMCVLLGGAAGRGLLELVWAGAALGVVQSIAWPRAPRALVSAVYVLLGWVVVPVLPALHRTLGGAPLALLAAGGVAYTVGAAVYAVRRPDPFPRVFGYHEVFHALVVLAAALHFTVVVQALRSIS